MIVEDGKDVNYPEKYKQIPITRLAYHYYLGYVRKIDTEEQQILVRRAIKPATNHRVELYAPISLKTKYDLDMGDEVVVRLE